MRISRYSLRSLLTLILLGVIALIAFKVMMYLRVQSAMDEFAKDMAHVAELTYQDIETNFTGGASVIGVSIRPLDVQEVVTIDRVQFASDNPLQFLLHNISKENMPEQLTLNLQGLRVPLNEDLLQSLRQPDPMSPLGIEQPQSGDICDGGMNTDPVMLQALGFEQLLIDMHMHYRYDRAAESLFSEMSLDLMQVQSMDMSMTLENIKPSDLTSGQIQDLPALVSADWSIVTSRSFGDGFLRYCAKQNGQTTDQYLASQLRNIEQNLAASGVTLGYGLQQAIADFYQEWGEVRIRVYPSQPLTPLALMQINSDNFVQRLGLRLWINDHAVDDLTFEFDMERLMEQAELEIEPEPPVYQPQKGPQRIRITRQFEPVAVSQLPKYLGAEVKIKPMRQPLRQGQLIEINDGEAYIRQRAHGGNITSYVRLREIESVEVELVKRTPLN